VRGNRDRVRISLELLAEVGWQGPYEVVGTFPSHDHCGYEVAITMLIASQRPDKHDPGHSQWDTIESTERLILIMSRQPHKPTNNC
jgi:hypothetical protein